MSSPTESIRAALDRVKALGAAATPGPWRAANGLGAAAVKAKDCAIYINVRKLGETDDCVARWQRDSVFNAEARTGWPLFARALEIALEIDQPAGLARDYCSGCGREYAERLLYRIARLLEEETHVG